MTETNRTCECGHPVPEKPGDAQLTVCPKCGRPVAEIAGGKVSRSMNLSDSALEATYEVMAEEGAIWSGAR